MIIIVSAFYWAQRELTQSNDLIVLSFEPWAASNNKFTSNLKSIMEFKN